MRTKEEEHDYRYFPDPDLMPLELTPDYVERIGASLPELPDAKKMRFVEEFGLSSEDAEVLVADRELAKCFEDLADELDARSAANWVIHDLRGALNKLGLTIAVSGLTAQKLRGLIDLVEADTISRRSANTEVLPVMIETDQDADSVSKLLGISQVSDTGAIESIVESVLAERPDMVAEYRAGKTKLLGFFVGQAMKASRGKANPKTVNQILRAKLDG